MRDLVLSLLLGFAFGGSFTGPVPQAVAATVPDSTITSLVLEKLAGRDQAYEGIEVKTRDGVVTLEGKVRTDAQKTLAEDLAKQVPGVRDVNNKLVVRAAK